MEGTAPQAEARPSLNETLSAAFDQAKVDAEPTAPVEAPAPAPVDKPAESKVDATGRSHAPDGKFSPKPAPVTTEQAPARPKPPTSWRQEHLSHWETLDPKLAAYLVEREEQFAKGVSTYKQEYDRFKPIAEALQPYQQMIQASGGLPQFIKALTDTHTTLSGQDMQAKLRAFARFAKDYQVPLEQLLVQGEDGKIYINQQLSQEQQPSPVSAQEIEKIVEAKVARERLQSMVTQFATEKGATGELLRPHFEKVKVSMDGLLRSGLVRDLQSAYDSALKLPQHADLAEADRLARDEAKTAAEAKAKAEAAERARANVISPRNQAPTALIPAGQGKKDLRSQLSDAFDQAGSRV